MPSHVAKLQAMLAELRKQTDASLQGLHTIRARTSKVLAATEAFTALATEAATMNRSLWAPTTASRLNDNAADRAAFQEELRLLVDELDTLRQRYASELALATSLPPPPKKPWWRIFS